MAAQKGVDVVVNVDTTGLGVFAAVGGSRNAEISIDNTPVDATSASSTGQWRELLDASGTRSVTISMDGVFQDDAQDTRLEELFSDRTHSDFQFVMPDFGTWEGSFAITNYRAGGAHDGEATFSATFESAGAITFTPA